MDEKNTPPQWSTLDAPRWKARKPKLHPTRFTAPVEELIGALGRVAPLEEWEAAAVQQRIIKEKSTALRMKLQAGQAELNALRLEYALTKNILGEEKTKP